VHTTPPITIDVSITDPLKVGEGALNTKAAEKHQHYDAFAERLGVLFYPFVLETYGTSHAECDLFVRKVASELPTPLRGPFRKRLVVAVQQALLIGNAQVARSAAERTLNHASSATRWWAR
jgi:hypothetical protein